MKSKMQVRHSLTYGCDLPAMEEKDEIADLKKLVNSVWMNH